MMGRPEGRPLREVAQPFRAAEFGRAKALPVGADLQVGPYRKVPGISATTYDITAIAATHFARSAGSILSMVSAGVW